MDIGRNLIISIYPFCNFVVGDIKTRTEKEEYVCLVFKYKIEDVDQFIFCSLWEKNLTSQFYESNFCWYFTLKVNISNLLLSTNILEANELFLRAQGAHDIIIKLRIEMGNMSKRQQLDKRAENSRRPPMSLQYSEKILHPEEGFNWHLFFFQMHVSDLTVMIRPIAIEFKNNPELKQVQSRTVVAMIH